MSHDPIAIEHFWWDSTPSRPYSNKNLVTSSYTLRAGALNRLCSPSGEKASSPVIDRIAGNILVRGMTLGQIIGRKIAKRGIRST